MAGTPTEAEIQTQLQNAVKYLEDMRNFIDGTVADGGGLWDVLEQSLEGRFTTAIAGVVRANRASMSQLIGPGNARALLFPILREYSDILAADATDGYGAAYTNEVELIRALYEFLDDNSDTINSRDITFDTSATAGGSNVGNGAMGRVTVDARGYDIENVHVERKDFRCRADRNSGTQDQAEVFEFVGEPQGADQIRVPDFGSGDPFRGSIVNTNAGPGRGGSILTNSDFQTYSASATPRFSQWTLVSGTTPTQNTTDYYQKLPGAQASADGHSAQFGANGKIAQTIALQSRGRRLDPTFPYFCRLMYNRQVGSGSMTLTLRLGSQSASVALSAQTGWNELLIPLGTGCWFENFNEADLDVEIEVSSYSSGYVLVDSVILAPMTRLDNTYWVLRQNNTSPVNWLRDDTLRFTDTGGAPATGKIQYWLWRAFNRYLPSASGGSETIADPS